MYSTLGCYSNVCESTHRALRNALCAVRRLPGRNALGSVLPAVCVHGQPEMDGPLWRNLDATASGWSWPSLASRQLDAIALRIQHNALVVTIPGAPRSFEHRMAVNAKPVREAIHFGLRPDGQSKMSETHPMGAMFQLHRRQRCRGHNFDACARLEDEEAGGEALRWVFIS